MEKFETKKINIEQTKISIYCDDCGKFLGSSIRENDGYYEKYGGFELSFNVNGEWYILNKNFCPKCKKKYIHNLLNALKKFDFKKEDY